MQYCNFVRPKRPVEGGDVCDSKDASSIHPTTVFVSQHLELGWAKIFFSQFKGRSNDAAHMK